MLGTLIDEPRGLAAAIREAVPASNDREVSELVTAWQRHVEFEQERIAQGRRDYADTDVIDAEAARVVADLAGLTDPTAVARLATASRRLPAWPDAVPGLERLARLRPLVALSNASRAALVRLNARAGLRWHLALSAQDAQAYKPAAAVYQLAVDAADCPAQRVLMVAAHAWDLRGAQAVGMRTAYVRRPVGDPPTDSDTFDLELESLDALAAELA